MFEIYHYSTNKLNSIKTKAMQGLVSNLEMKEGIKVANEMNEVGAYFQHLSFFFDKIPSDIATIFGPGHNFWFKGNEIYEHTVLVKDIEVFKWHLVEAPSTVAFANSMQWEGLNVATRRCNISVLNDHDRREGYIGDGEVELSKALKPFLGKTRDAFINEREVDVNRESFKQYAAGVPHLMIYPDVGIVRPHSVRKIVLK